MTEHLLTTGQSSAIDRPITGAIPVAGVITAGTYAADDPVGGLEAVLRLIEHAEQLGFDSVGVRQRHLERGISSALTVLAAASQRTKRITLETNVVPLGFETPFRLAEDFSTVWALAAGRLHVGVSSSAPHADLLRGVNRTDVQSDTDPYPLIARFLEALDGRSLSDEPLSTPYGPEEHPHVQPHIPGLRDRVWLGGGSNRSVDWAAAHGLNLFLGNLTDAEGDADFGTSQRLRIERFRAGVERAQADANAAEPVDATADARLAAGEVAPAWHPAPRVGVERVLLPIDSATSAQREHYAHYAASREARTHVTHGPRRTVIARDLHGTSEQIAEALAADPVFDGRTELRASLPYGFAEAEYAQILTDIRERVLPQLGWEPAQAEGIREREVHA